MSNWKQGYIPEQPKPSKQQSQPRSINEQHISYNQQTYQPQQGNQGSQQQAYIQEQPTQYPQASNVQKQHVKCKRSVPLFISLLLCL